MLFERWMHRTQNLITVAVAAAQNLYTQHNRACLPSCSKLIPITPSISNESRATQ
jgi:hypothetical protein